MPLHLALPADVEALVGVDLAGGDAVQSAFVATQPPGTTAAEGDDSEEETSTASALLSFLPLVAIAAAGYFLLIRPARRRQRDQVELTRSVDVGDEVLLTSGVVGFITAKLDDVYWVEIDDDVQIRVVPGAISRKWTSAPDVAAPTAEPDAAATTTDADANAIAAPITATAPTTKPGVKGRPKANPTPTTATDDVIAERDPDA